MVGAAKYAGLKVPSGVVDLEIRRLLERKDMEKQAKVLELVIRKDAKSRGDVGVGGEK